MRATDEFRGTRVTRHCVVVQLERYLQHKRVAYCSDPWVSSDEWRENMPSSSQFLGVFPIRPVCVAATTNALLNSSSSTYGNVAFLNELVCREGKDRVEKKGE